MQAMLFLLLLSVTSTLCAAETLVDVSSIPINNNSNININNTSSIVVATTSSSQQPQQQLQPPHQQRYNDQSAMMPESKRVEPVVWSSSVAGPPEIPIIPAQAYLPSPPNPPSMQPILPQTNYYLPPDNNNHYHDSYPEPPEPPSVTTTEFRSDHYPAYPFEPSSPSQYPYAYSMSQQSAPFDVSLMPTAKHFVIVSFIGLLLLFAVIQNSIAAAKRKDALVEVLSNRKKRDLIASTTPDRSILLHSMTPEAESALKDDARVRCIQRTLCYENRKLIDDLGGIFGRLLANYLTGSVQKSLKGLSPGWDRLVKDAADAGLRGEDCDVLYRDCNYNEAIDNDD